MADKKEGGVIPGTVDLIILRTLADGPLHGFGISRSLRDRSGGVVELQDAALYQALHRLSRQGLLQAEWGVSDSNRRAKFYELTEKGSRQLAREEAHFRRYVDAVMRVLSPGAVGA